MGEEVTESVNFLDLILKVPSRAVSFVLRCKRNVWEKGIRRGSRTTDESRPLVARCAGPGEAAAIEGGNTRRSPRASHYERTVPDRVCKNVRGHPFIPL